MNRRRLREEPEFVIKDLENMLWSDILRESVLVLTGGSMPASS